MLITAAIVPSIAIALTAAALGAISTQPQPASSWKDDPAWHQGKAEWALYDATRTIYGKSRMYEATIFTNRQVMDPATTTKAEGDVPGGIEVFKHNISEIIPTENYQYRFLTTCFLTADALRPYRVTVSTQEDCGSSFRNFNITTDQTVRATQFCYFPGQGNSEADYTASGTLAFHNSLSLSLRDFPFGAQFIKAPELTLVSEQRNPRVTSLAAANATISDMGEEVINVPYGQVRTHHLRVDHEPVDGTTQSDFWFALDPGMRNVMVQYRGPFGVEYQLKRLQWWAYWSDPKPGKTSR
ncbi:MAG: hypothetical protein ACR2GY_04850 [Phycisphaerales bacterium]